MWLGAAEPASQGDQTAIILGVIGALSLVLVAAVSGIFALLTAKANRTAPAPPPPTSQPPDLSFRDYVVGELAVARSRDDDHDEAREIVDRRIDQIERHLDLEDPSWRHDGRSTDA